MAEQKVCKNCKWWLEMDEDKKRGPIGECYRYPPTFAEDNPDFADKRPLTLGMDYCGEYIPRKEVKQNHS